MNETKTLRRLFYFFLASAKLIMMASGQLYNWKGSPFNELEQLIKDHGISEVYILPNIEVINKLGVINRRVGLPTSIGIIDVKDDIDIFKKLIINNCSDSERPQLMGKEYKFIIILNKIDPVVKFRAFDDRGIWYLWYEFEANDQEAPLVFTKKCDTKFNEFLSSKLVAIQPP